MPISTQTTDILNDVYNLTLNSLATYIVAAEPYVPKGQEVILENIQDIANDNAVLAKEIAGCMRSLDVMPYSTSFHTRMSELNYLSIGYLKNVLINELGAEHKQIEKFINECKERSGLPNVTPHSQDMVRVITILEKTKSKIESALMQLSSLANVA